jgi:hypothetical protein
MNRKAKRVASAGPVRWRRRLQRDVLRDVMLSASECDTWLTLEELARITRYPAASISAQLRHLRKPRHGGFLLRKRCRAVEKSSMSRVEVEFAHGPLWEYRLERWRPPVARRVARRVSARGVRLHKGRA